MRCRRAHALSKIRQGSESLRNKCSVHFIMLANMNDEKQGVIGVVEDTSNIQTRDLAALALALISKSFLALSECCSALALA